MQAEKECPVSSGQERCFVEMNEGWIGLTEHQDLATSQLFSIKLQADPQKGIGFLNSKHLQTNCITKYTLQNLV